MKELSLMIDDCVANEGTHMDITVDSDISCYSSESESTNKNMEE